MLVFPELVMSSLLMTSTGVEVSASTRLMFEPVTSIFSTFWACWATAGVTATVPNPGRR
jgi:hypothetical protein